MSERTKTAEELAELERQRLEALETRRLKRMRAGADETGDALDDDGGDVVPAGGYKARRQKRQKGLQREQHGPSGGRQILSAAEFNPKYNSWATWCVAVAASFGQSGVLRLLACPCYPA